MNSCLTGRRWTVEVLSGIFVARFDFCRILVDFVRLVSDFCQNLSDCVKNRTKTVQNLSNFVKFCPISSKIGQNRSFFAAGFSFPPSCLRLTCFLCINVKFFFAAGRWTVEKLKFPQKIDGKDGRRKISYRNLL